MKIKNLLNPYIYLKLLEIMITEANKRELIDWITSLENQSMLEHLMELKNSDETEKIYIVSDLERRAIQEGIDSLEKEGGIADEEVKKITKAKYPNLFKH
jgi:hypothetical protein